jgi:hypothetical protein
MPSRIKKMLSFIWKKMASSLVVAAGDGFFGEIQFMIAAFFSFFVVLWLLIAWIF